MGGHCIADRIGLAAASGDSSKMRRLWQLELVSVCRTSNITDPGLKVPDE